MKTKLLIIGSLALALLAMNTLTTRADPPLRNTGGPMTMFVRGPGGSMITAATPLSTPLWDSRFGNPAIAPDGHQLTLGEWLQPEPRAAMNCVEDGTHVTIHVSGLIPKGVYTMWVVIFDGPFGVAGPGKPAPFGHLVGAGALGPNDGSQNTFQASASGEGQLSVIVPPQLLSWAGPPFLNSHYLLEGCLLDEVGVHLVGLYHFDGQPYGPVPGHQHGAAEQFAIMFHP